jgi:hypothetical protein
MLNFNIFNAGNAVVNQDGTPTREFYAFCRSLWNSLGGGQTTDIPQQVGQNKNDIASEKETRAHADETLQTNINGKQDKLTPSQLAAVNSGIDLSKTQQITTNQNNIATINQTIGGYGDIVTHQASEFVAYPASLPAQIAQPVGGSVEDVEARAAINAIIAVLEEYSLTQNS